jgi:nicotinamidase-related amidase
VVVSKHWSSSSFQSTDLDFQLRQRRIENLVLAGMTANTCLESMGRYAYELGYYVAMLKDATAGWNKEQVDTATELIWPLFAIKVTTTGSGLRRWRRVRVRESKGVLDSATTIAPIDKRRD